MQLAPEKKRRKKTQERDAEEPAPQEQPAAADE